MEVTPIPGTPMVLAVSPVKRIAPVRKGVNKSASKDEPENPEKPIPELSPGTGELVDLYV